MTAIEPGEKFGRLTAKTYEGKTSGRAEMWKCKCECGQIRIVKETALKSGHTKSCGCLSAEMTRERTRTHGASKTPLHFVWRAMKQRCENPQCGSYKNYGARGIAVSPEWQKFENFKSDMGDAPAGMSLERKNNDLGYSKENCVWASRATQSRNTRANRNVTINGESRCLTDWAEAAGIKLCTIKYRIRSGWSDQKAISTPTRRKP